MPSVTDVIDGILRPPLGVLHPVLDQSGPYGPGDHNRTIFTTTGAGFLPSGSHPVYGTYGVIVVPNGAIPVPWGYDIGYDSGLGLGLEGWRYHNRLCQVVTMHELITGFFAPIDVIDVHYAPQMIQWPFRLLGQSFIGLHVSPTIAIDLYYLCIA